MSDLFTTLQNNYHTVCQKIDEAAGGSDRKAEDIKLIAVTKYVEADLMQMLFDCGCRQFGESRPQAMWQKAEQLSNSEINWHLIGHLQRNKVQRTLPLTAMIHSVDRMRLVKEIDRMAGELQLKPKLLLEVNISGDQTKHGFLPEDMSAVIAEVAAFENIEVCGLMAMAALAGGVNAAERDFEAMGKLQESLITEYPANQSLANINLNELSMGMSRDYEIAIRHGATMVRVGSALFEGIERG